MRRLTSKIHFNLLVLLLIGLCGPAVVGQDSSSQEPESEKAAEEISGSEQVVEEPTQNEVVISPLGKDGNLVQFARDIVPILRTSCLECHGPEDAKNDFRVDDRDTMLDYIEPGDAESSTLYVDYLTIDDEDMLMPPRNHGGPLSASELALIRVWIEEGADWPEDFAFVEKEASQEAVAVPPETPDTVPERIWAAQGFLHPATVHFPIALFMLGAGFVVLGWKWPGVGTQIPLACLLIGSASAVAATSMGWAFAPEQGYGTGWNILDWDREVDAHRWSGVIVTGLSVVFAIIALMALWKGSEKLTRVWKVGLLACAAFVGAVGHQGGEMTYGKDFYPKALRILTGASTEPAAVETSTQESSAATAFDTSQDALTLNMTALPADTTLAKDD